MKNNSTWRGLNENYPYKWIYIRNTWNHLYSFYRKRWSRNKNQFNLASNESDHDCTWKQAIQFPKPVNIFEYLIPTFVNICFKSNDLFDLPIFISFRVDHCINWFDIKSKLNVNRNVFVCNLSENSELSCGWTHPGSAYHIITITMAYLNANLNICETQQLC